MAIYKLRILRTADYKLDSLYTVSDTPFEVGCTYTDVLHEVGSPFKVLEILEMIPQRKEI